MSDIFFSKVEGDTDSFFSKAERDRDELIYEIRDLESDKKRLEDELFEIESQIEKLKFGLACMNW